MISASRCVISALSKNVDLISRQEGTRQLARMNNVGPNAGIIIIGDEILKGQTRVR